MIRYLFLLFFCTNCFAVGTAGLDYVVYAAGGPTPSRTAGTVVGSGTVTSLNYDWGGGIVMNSGRVDGVKIHFTGYILWPGTAGSGNKTVSFYDRSDDGFYMTINNTLVINNWVEQGPANFNSSGSITLTAGQVYAIDIWWYENGGGAVVQLDWNIGSGIVVVPSTNYGTSSSYFVPPLCCGGTSASFTPNATNLSNIQSFINRASADSQVYIEQIGSNNTITVEQSSINNYTDYNSNGNSNITTVTQTSTNQTSTNYAVLNINGNSNTTTLNQQSSGGVKSAFININNNNNSLILQQKDSGSDYAEITLTGGNKQASITQQGSGNHQTSVTLSGQPTNLNLIQSGNTQQSYSINFNCATAGGCAAIQVQQGQ